MQTRTKSPLPLRFLERGIRFGARLLTRPISDLVARNYGTITRVQTSEPVAAITFDEGPHPEITPEILELLESYGARGTFFWLGRYAEENPHIVRRAAEAGHCVANHTYDHPSFRMIGSKERRKQLRLCSQALRPYEEHFFRPPYGHQSIGSHIDIHRSGYQVIGWDVTACDWRDHSGSWMAERMISRMSKGSILLLHDRIFLAEQPNYFAREPMVEALHILLERCSREYRFVTIPELLTLGRPEGVNWYWKGDRDWLHSLQGEHGEHRTYSADSPTGWIDTPADLTHCVTTLRPR